jgi:hypothetical protein
MAKITVYGGKKTGPPAKKVEPQGTKDAAGKIIPHFTKGEATLKRILKFKKEGPTQTADDKYFEKPSVNTQAQEFRELTALNEKQKAKASNIQGIYDKYKASKGGYDNLSPHIKDYIGGVSKSLVEENAPIIKRIKDYEATTNYLKPDLKGKESWRPLAGEQRDIAGVAPIVKGATPVSQANLMEYVKSKVKPPGGAAPTGPSPVQVDQQKEAQTNAQVNQDIHDFNKYVAKKNKGKIPNK